MELPFVLYCIPDSVLLVEDTFITIQANAKRWGMIYVRIFQISPFVENIRHITHGRFLVRELQNKYICRKTNNTKKKK